MKALLLLLLGVCIFTFCGVQFIQRDDIHGTALGALCFVGIITGAGLALYGLIANHHDHTRRR